MRRRVIAYDSAKPSIVWTDSGYDAATLGKKVFTFSGKSVGTAHPKRFVFVATDITPDTMTIAGVSATKFVQAGALSIWGALVPTGSTATIVLTTIGTPGRGIRIQVLAAYNLLSTTPFATTSVSLGVAVGTINVNVNTPAFGIVVAASSNFRSDPAASWSGATLGNNLNVGLDTISAASVSDVAAQTPRSVSVTWPATANEAVSASFR